jgi:hypothetical protein
MRFLFLAPADTVGIEVTKGMGVFFAAEFKQNGKDFREDVGFTKNDTSRTLHV